MNQLSTKHVMPPAYLDDNGLMFLISFYTRTYNNKNVFIFDSMFFTRLCDDIKNDMNDDELFNKYNTIFQKMNYDLLGPLITIIPINITHQHFFVIAASNKLNTEGLVEFLFFDSLENQTYNQHKTISKLFENN